MRAIRLLSGDQVATVLQPVQAGDTVTVEDSGTTFLITAAQDVPFGHKIAVTDLPVGTSVCKYGEVIGVATAAIPLGSHVHEHNLRSLRGGDDV